MPDDLLERFRRHDRLALARLLTLVARGEAGDELLAQLGTAPKPSRVVAITGSAGVGKSTLAGKLIELLRRQSQTVAVLACDPQSPVSGGALLGDRFRMPAQPDDGVFIRSLAAPGGQGAVARHLDTMVRLLEAFGFDVVLIETVGAGQGDTTVRGLADVVVLLLQPETGDDLQWEKAGVLEIADVIAIQKADLPGAENVEAQVRGMLSLSTRPVPVVVRISAKTGTGIDELWRAIETYTRCRGDGTHLLPSQEGEAAMRYRDMVKELLAVSRHLDIVTVLDARFGSVPEELGDEFRSIKSEKLLLELVRQAALCPDLKTFRSHVRRITKSR